MRSSPVKYKIYAEHGVVDGACGIDVAQNFCLYDPDDGDYDDKPYGSEVKDWEPDLGSGWLVMGFNKQPESKAAYEAFSAKYPIVYQSPVRDNTNHERGHKFFFAVFDTKKKRK